MLKLAKPLDQNLLVTAGCQDDLGRKEMKPSQDNQKI